MTKIRLSTVAVSFSVHDIEVTKLLKVQNVKNVMRRRIKIAIKSKCVFIVGGLSLSSQVEVLESFDGLSIKGS